MVELTDKATGEKIVTPDKPSAIFRYIKENPKYGMTSWRVGPYMSIETLNAADHEVRLKSYHVSGMRRLLSYEIKFACNTLNVTAELRGESKIINFHIDVDWNELGTGAADWDSQGTGNYIPQLNFYLPVAYAAKDYKYDIPFGFIDRADIPHDVPGNSFMRINNAADAPSAFIVTDTKYGFRGHDNAGAVTLIRASYDPDYDPERCRHHINIGVGVCEENEQKRLAVEYVHPIAFNAGVKHNGGTLPMCGSVAKIADENRDSVMISGVKNGEDGGFILRVSDYAGRGGKISLTLSDLVPAPNCAQIVDITERHVLADCAVDGKTISFDIDPFALATIRIK
jgi:alpha-mannosidase